MTTKDRGPLKYVIVPDVDGLPSNVKPCQKFHVKADYANGTFDIQIGSITMWHCSLNNCSQLNGANWIPIYANDVIDGFGEYRTRGGLKAVVSIHKDGLWIGGCYNKHGAKLRASFTWNSDGTISTKTLNGKDDPDMDIIGKWEEAGEQVRAEETTPQTAAALSTLQRLGQEYEAPQEIPAAEAIDWRAECYEAVSIIRMFPEMEYPKGTAEFLSKPHIEPFWFRVKPFGKEEARKRLLAGDRVKPVHWEADAYLEWWERDLCVRDNGQTRYAMMDFPDNQLFVKAGE